MSRLFLLMIFCCFIGLCGCYKNDHQISIDLKNEVKKEVKHRIRLLSPDLDSLCSLNHDRDLRIAIDSIFQVRKAAIDKISDQ